MKMIFFDIFPSSLAIYPNLTVVQTICFNRLYKNYSALFLFYFFLCSHLSIKLFHNHFSRSINIYLEKTKFFLALHFHLCLFTRVHSLVFVHLCSFTGVH